MNMESPRFEPPQETRETQVSSEVALVNDVLKSVPEGSGIHYDGARLSWNQGNKSGEIPFRLDQGSNVTGFLFEISGRAEYEELKRATVLRAILRASDNLPGTGYLKRLHHAFGAIPVGVKRQSEGMLARFQRKNSRTNAGLATGKASTQSEGEPARGFSQQDTMKLTPTLERPEPSDVMANLDRLRALHDAYATKWKVTGGHADPNTFQNVGEGLLKLALVNDQEARRRLEGDLDQEMLAGITMELFLGVEIEEKQWFGTDAEVVRVAAYDDFANGLDLAIEWPRDPVTGVIPRLAIDFTTASSESVFKKKLKKLSKGTAANFYRSKVEVFEGRVEDMPMVILGFSPAVLRRIGGSLRRGNEVTREHPTRALVLRQAEIQVGLQIRTLAAALAESVLSSGRNGYDEETRAATSTYSEAVRDGRANVALAVEMMRGLNPRDLEKGLGRRDAERFRTLLAVYPLLAEQVAHLPNHPSQKQFEDQDPLLVRVKARDRAQQTPPLPAGSGGVLHFLVGIVLRRGV